MTYKRNIMNLKKMNYDWHAYDWHFRMDMEMQPIPWSANRHADPVPAPARIHLSAFSGQIHGRKRWIKASGEREEPANRAREIHPSGILPSYHTKGRACTAGTECKYQHKCPACDKRHPVLRPCGSAHPRVMCWYQCLGKTLPTVQFLFVTDNQSVTYNINNQTSMQAI